MVLGTSRRLTQFAYAQPRNRDIVSKVHGLRASRTQPCCDVSTHLWINERLMKADALSFSRALYLSVRWFDMISST